MTYSIIIATYNRAEELRETLRSVADLQTRQPWEVIVVDNNSTDATRAVVEEAAHAFPVPLRYVFEAEQGKPAALNTAMAAARGSIFAFTDDDARVAPDWLDQAGAALERLRCDYVGGRVFPIWRGDRPAWLPNRAGKLWAVVALMDHGEQVLEFGAGRIGWPLGVNMVVRREAFDRVGGWDNGFGRQGTTLRGQEQRDWCLRARAAGLRGFYVPAMVVEHVIPADRLNKPYFRRWFYWHGISRAMLSDKLRVDLEKPEHGPHDVPVRTIAGVPRHMYRKLAQNTAAMLRARRLGDEVEAFRLELWICFFAGIVRQRWRDRRAVPAGNSPVVGSAS